MNPGDRDLPLLFAPSAAWPGQAPLRQVAVLIPAYRPDHDFEELVEGLLAAGVPALLLVDDGSGPTFAELFARIALHAKVHLLRHPHNLGKGSALKTGIRYFLEHLPHYKGLVTADCDGQHAAEDIVRVARVLQRSPRLAVLGARSFVSVPGREIPLRSRVGNRVTAGLIRSITRLAITDAQTGLRGLPTQLLRSLVGLPGTRYDYEMAVLLHIARSGHPLAEQPIRTIYDDGNGGSHFRPILDSLRVLRVLLGRRVTPLAFASPDSSQDTAAASAARSSRTLRTK